MKNVKQRKKKINMKREELKEKLSNGFNVAMLAEAFDCSVGRINELKCEPVEGEVYYKKNINTNALYDFAVKHGIDLDVIDFDAIAAAAKKVKNEATKIEVGTVTEFGEVLNVEKVGQSYVYVIRAHDGKIIVKGTKDLK